MALAMIAPDLHMAAPSEMCSLESTAGTRVRPSGRGFKR